MSHSIEDTMFGIPQKAPKPVCAHKRYRCNQPPVPTSQFCVLHVFQDPNAGYKRCPYIYGDEVELQCIRAVLTDGPDKYCADHIRMLEKKRQERLAEQKRRETGAALLRALQHNIKPPVSKDFEETFVDFVGECKDEWKSYKETRPLADLIAKKRRLSFDGPQELERKMLKYSETAEDAKLVIKSDQKQERKLAYTIVGQQFNFHGVGWNNFAIKEEKIEALMDISENVSQGTEPIEYMDLE